jgi:maleate isomerase
VADRVLRLGVLTPHLATDPEAEFETMAAGRVVTRVARVSAAAVPVSRTGSPPPAVAARVLTRPPLLDDAAVGLVGEGVDAIGYASTSGGYALGYAGEIALVDRLARRAGVPIAGTATSTVLALRTLGVRRVALVHPPWFGQEANELGAAYFRSQGLAVVSAVVADLVADPDRIEAAAVVEWTTGRVPDTAEAVYLGGNGFRMPAAIEALEERIGRPVLTSNQVLLWTLCGLAGARFQVRGFGRLFGYAVPMADGSKVARP